jgi:hypothetical protein
MTFEPAEYPPGGDFGQEGKFPSPGWTSHAMGLQRWRTIVYELGNVTLVLTAISLLVKVI